MQPYDEAKARANEIVKYGLVNCFVTMSWGCEYCNSYDVEPDMPTPTPPTTKGMVQAIQVRLNELGAKPQLKPDGIMGPATLRAIITALKPVTRSP